MYPFIYLSVYLGSQPPEENGGDGEDASGEDLDARVERLMAAQANIKAKHFYYYDLIADKVDLIFFFQKIASIHFWSHKIL